MPEESNTVADGEQSQLQTQPADQQPTSQRGDQSQSAGTDETTPPAAAGQVGQSDSASEAAQASTADQVEQVAQSGAGGEEANAAETYQDEPPASESASPEAPAVDAPAPAGPRWYSVTTSSQAGPINLLLVDRVSDEQENERRVVERFKLGHGIRHTPHAIAVSALPEDYVPTGADVDHHESIEVARRRSLT